MNFVRDPGLERWRAQSAITIGCYQLSKGDELISYAWVGTLAQDGKVIWSCQAADCRFHKNQSRAEECARSHFTAAPDVLRATG
jgi:hypothetical protein